ncbi:MAG: prepilin-type N-terminal cleavage/methylation domain-containing protein [candidate division NC10 bacterium]|nr:prepilin-type N-terminal cleavage/methylation domain-containing protein [candidate division NC10 bacterium]
MQRIKNCRDWRWAMEGQGGFTLVELLVAAVLLLVAVLSIASLFPTGRTNVDVAARKSFALALAQQNLEVIKNSAFPPSSGGCPAPLPSGYTCNVSVSLSGTAPNRMAAVAVTVGWGTLPRSGSVTLHTRMSE